MSTAIATRTPVDITTVESREFINELAKTFCRMVGSNVIEDGKVAALVCISEDITVMEFLRKYHIIQGKPAMKSDAMLAEFRLKGGGHDVVARTDKRAAIKLYSPGKEDGAVFELTWKQMEDSRFPWVDWKDHKKGLKTNWATAIDRKNMLWVRLISDSVRAIAPEIVAGIYAPEELLDSVTGSSDAKAAPAGEDLAALASGETVTEDGEIVDGGIVDAEFAISKEEPAESPSNPDRCSLRQRERIRELFVECEVTAEHQAAALQKRGCNAINNLSREQAKDLILRMESRLSKKD